MKWTTSIQENAIKQLEQAWQHLTSTLSLVSGSSSPVFRMLNIQVWLQLLAYHQILFRIETPRERDMVHTDPRPFFSSTFQGLFKVKSHIFKDLFLTQFDLHAINPSIQMTFCMGCSAKKHAIQTGNGLICGTGNQITNLSKWPCFDCV